MTATKLSTKLLHADFQSISLADSDVSPAISTSTTFRQEMPAHVAVFLEIEDHLLQNQSNKLVEQHIYSRDSTSTRSRLEILLGALEEDAYAVSYSSGLSALHAALVCYQPKRVAIREGYFGCHEVIAMYGRGRSMGIIDIDELFQEGDLVILETPKNPRGEIDNLQKYTELARKAHAIVLVDATLAPPPLQYTLAHGCDMVLHSSTKFLGGHSDLLGGVLLVRDKIIAEKLRHDRDVLGSVMGSLEAWLLIRSLRTLPLRVTIQSNNAQKLIGWLSTTMRSTYPNVNNEDAELAGMIETIHHASQLPEDLMKVARSQMPGGWSPVFSVELCDVEAAQALPYLLTLMQPATSLGGVESLIEWRRQCDPNVSPKLLRVSVGLEDPEDMIVDWRQALYRAKRLMQARVRREQLTARHKQ